VLLGNAFVPRRLHITGVRSIFRIFFNGNVMQLQVPVDRNYIYCVSFTVQYLAPQCSHVSTFWSSVFIQTVIGFLIFRNYCSETRMMRFEYTETLQHMKQDTAKRKR